MLVWCIMFPFVFLIVFLFDIFLIVFGHVRLFRESSREGNIQRLIGDICAERPAEFCRGISSLLCLSVLFYAPFRSFFRSVSWVLLLVYRRRTTNKKATATKKDNDD